MTRTTHLHFNQPVDQDCPHLWVEAGLHVHVVTKHKLFLEMIKSEGDSFVIVL